MFSSHSLETPQVHKLFPKACSIAPQFYPMWFARSSILMYINCWGMHMFLFCNWGSEEVLPLGSAQMFQKKCWWGNENYDSFQGKKKRKGYECTRELINMNDTISPSLSSFSSEALMQEYSPSETCELLFQVAHFFLILGYFVLLHTKRICSK
jgi:hypothetical protein